MNDSERRAVVVRELVGSVQTLTRLSDQIHRDRERDRSAPARLLEQHGQRLTVHPLHDHEEHAVLFAQVERRRDIGC